MLKKSFFVVYLMLLGHFSCKKNNKENIIKEVKIVLDTTQRSRSLNLVWDKNTTIADGIVYRSGENNNWKSVFATNIFGFKNNPPHGEFAQIVPLRTDLPTIELKITKTTKRNDVDDYDKKYDWYEVELEPIKNKNYWIVKSPKNIRAEYPSDILVIYPAIKNVSLLDINKLEESELPKNTTINAIKGALDFNNDGLPDAVVTQFCCGNKTNKKDCEYECGETYLKLSGNWLQINSSQPL